MRTPFCWSLAIALGAASVLGQSEEPSSRLGASMESLGLKELLAVTSSSSSVVNRIAQPIPAVLILLALIAAGLGQPALRGDEEPEVVKAAFVYRLCQFVAWPDASLHRPFVIGVIGKTPVQEPLQRIVVDKRLGGRPVEVRYFARMSQLDEDVEVLFIPERYRRWTDRILRRYEDQPTLTIGDFEDFVERGGMVALAFRGDRLSLELNHTASRDAGLRISPQLLAVADEVHGPR